MLLDIKIFNRKCDVNNIIVQNTEKQTNLKKELMREILKKAAIYEKQKTKTSNLIMIIKCR